MAFIYLIMAMAQGLMWVLYWALVFGVPLLILWRLVRNRRTPGRAALWAAIGAVWITPMVVELGRDRLLAQWFARLPPAPMLMLDAGSVLVLDNGVINPETGRAQFALCTNHEYDTPFCDFSLGAEVALARHSLALSRTKAPMRWQQAEDCDLNWYDNTVAEQLSAYFVAQGICARDTGVAPDAPRVDIQNDTAKIPFFPGHSYGQLTATGPNGQTTLTAFDLTRPAFPALWGVHWLPILAGVVPQFTTTDLRYGKTFDEAAMTGQPPGSFQAMVYAQGWNTGPDYDTDIWAKLATQFPYDPARALPALRSNSFFPTRFAIELACAPDFRARISHEVVVELRRIANQANDIGNDYPRQLATEALENGCGAGPRNP